MVFYIQEGDIFNIPQIRNYAHGCNCAGAMGKGIALQFRKQISYYVCRRKAVMG